MNPCHSARRMICVLASSLAIAAVGADITPAPPRVAGVTVSNGQQRVTWMPYPAADAFRLLSATNISGTFTPKSGAIPGLEWTGPANGNTEFHRVEVTPMSSNALLSAIVLNRLAYGPTPDEIERVLTGPSAIGPQAFINEQLAPEAITETIDFDVPSTNINWVQVTASGTASGSNFFMYLSGAGSVFIDDVRLVRGTNLSTGQNLLFNEGFEDVLTPPWNAVGNYTNSMVTNLVSHSGNNCLQLTAVGGGTGGSTNSVFQLFPHTNNNTVYTLSFWYLPDRVGSNVNLTVRLNGSVTTATVPVRPPTGPVAPGTIYARLTNSMATIDDLRAWVSYRAVRSKTQLLEVLAQFWDNHFNTQYGKSRQWFSDNYGALTNETELATDFEFRETSKWRQVLMNPNGTFLDLLKISSESPGMMIYLDSVLSSRTTPNENYPRELLELFTMGSDNGYIQNDINELSKAWTGVRVVKKAPENADNLFAPAVASYTNDPGVFVLHFSTNSHNTTVKRLFTNNVVAARFGPPYAGQSYSLILSNGIGTNGWRDMPAVIAHLANLPYTQEFISVKLCQLFVHENFEYGVYDYTASNLSPEGRLIRDCMTAWRTPGPDGRQGNLRAILRTIFNSTLFRSHGSSQQKVKSPFEFAVSAVRALRANVGGTNYTADTDGYDIRTPINRMGNMNMFDREEPDGYPETGRLWLNTANLCERMRFAQHLCMALNSSLKDDDYGGSGDDNTSNPVLLLKTKTPSQTWNDAGAVADFFLGLLFPGDGRANLSVERDAAIAFLNSNDAGTPNSSLFNSLGDSSAAYDGRVRSMVGMLMSLPRFQEQ